MKKEILDLTNLHFHKIMLKIAEKTMSMQTGNILEIISNYPKIDHDIYSWCQKFDKALLSVKHEDHNVLRFHIQF